MQNIDFWHFIYNGSIHLSFKVYQSSYMFSLFRCKINAFINWQKLRKKITTEILGLLLSPFFDCMFLVWVATILLLLLGTNELSWHILHIVFACCTFNCHYTSIHYIERGFPLSKTLFSKKKEKKKRQTLPWGNTSKKWWPSRIC